jgi:hypothetical protein
VGFDEIRVGTRVRVRGDHRIESRREAVGKIMGRYGGREHVAVDVQLSDGRRRLFWPADLEEVSPPQPWWRSMFEGRLA